MIAFDINVVVRLMVEDDVAQARRSRQLHGEAVEWGEPVLITDIVLCELEWVLESAYKVPRDRILAAVQALVADQRFCFESAARLVRALDRYQHGLGDLSDHLLGLAARDAGAATTYTFDRVLRAEEHFTALG